MTQKKARPSRSGGEESKKVEARRRAYRKDREGALRKLDAKLDGLKKELLEATSGTREDLNGAMTALATKRRRFVGRLAELREASGDAWNELRQGVDDSWDELEDAFGALRKGVAAAVGRFRDRPRS